MKLSTYERVRQKLGSWKENEVEDSSYFHSSFSPISIPWGGSNPAGQSLTFTNQT